DVKSLEVGDYVVHYLHGIGIYNGIKSITSNQITKDYLEVLYQDNDKMYIPVEKIDLLSKYSARDGFVPKLNKLGGTEWKKTKARVKSKVVDMANQLIQLYAERDARRGFKFSKDTEYNIEFEKNIPFVLTTDQVRAISQIKEDMESSQPMDRLLCGDVGFGKTEVAFVAAFKAIMDSKQVLLLCPTTILSKQHYDNALVRFKNFPVNIALLNRFTSKNETERILNGLRDGTIDFVIGTHRLLSNDIHFKDIGLLIIDEEQRFGVRHKEKIKQYKTNVDVLTLTATPIPRTLQMSLSGIRGLSLIETPPVNRFPVQTYVVEENRQIIKDAIYKELSRKGQVFILYNRVQSIEEYALKIQNIVPDARIGIAHGKMNKYELENTIMDFVQYKFDILVCTTIIETGIDIPNVNTLIILDADHFGLSQLYQIRGRVGRSDKFAYAYLMYQPFKTLTDTAIKRLNVIKQFTELGSGFSIATRDLSIRGAGNLLGSEQAGFIDSIGIDLYLKMLQDEVDRMKGLKSYDEEEDSNKSLINVTTHIDDGYVVDDELKIEIHRMINTVHDQDSFNLVKEELEDRFGKVSDDLTIYMYEEWFEKLAKKLSITHVHQTKNSIELVFPKEVVDTLNIDDIFMESYQISNMFRFRSLGNNLIIVLDIIKLDQHPIYYLVSLLDMICSKYKKNID
ncbi:MAG: transcription-repair coupling factor, partial [Bacilli bacterium]|nr:transcription-repair coupling factor [Bacilli bacterium]